MVSKADIQGAQIIEDLHANWTPHPGQIKALSPLVQNNADTLFLSCARKWGKSEASMYILWRMALTRPGSANYYIAPELTHGRELIWSNARLKKFGPQKYVDRVLNNESRMIFKNGSFIKIVGSENWGAANGITPDCVVYDEFKAFHPQFHIEMNPNRLVRNAPLVIIGTPPHGGDRNYEQYMENLEECKNSDTKVFIRQPSWENPHVSKDWLDKEKERLIKNGDYDVWYREYEARIVAGGRNAVFPMFDRNTHVVPIQNLKRDAKTRRQKSEWWVGADPATVSVFGGLAVRIDLYNKKVQVLDEIYEKEGKKTSVGQIYPRFEALMHKWIPNCDIHDDWFKVYDEREAWFSNEVMANYGVYFTPSQKLHNTREDGINLIKDLMTHELLEIGKNCENLIHEIETCYKKDGKIPNRHFHLVDVLRYILGNANYSMVEALEKKKIERMEKRAFRIKDDLEQELDQEDWTRNFERSLKW